MIEEWVVLTRILLENSLQASYKIFEAAGLVLLQVKELRNLVGSGILLEFGNKLS